MRVRRERQLMVVMPNRKQYLLGQTSCHILLVTFFVSVFVSVHEYNMMFIQYDSMNVRDFLKPVKNNFN